MMMFKFHSESKDLGFRLKLLIANLIVLIMPIVWWEVIDKIKAENWAFQRIYNVRTDGNRVLFVPDENADYPMIEFDSPWEAFSYLVGCSDGMRGDIKFHFGTIDDDGSIIWRDFEVA